MTGVQTCALPIFFGAFIPPIVTHYLGATWSMGATMVAAALLALLMTLLAGSRGRDPHSVDAEVMP